jgi:hypothetical protein
MDLQPYTRVEGMTDDLVPVLSAKRHTSGATGGGW